MVALQIRPPFDACCSRLPWGRCPPLPLVVLPLIASALLRYARSPSRRDRSGAPCIRRLCALTATAAPANAAGGGGWAQKPARPRRGSAAPPPVPSRAVPRVAVGGRRALRQAPAIPFLKSVAVGSSGRTLPPPPRAPGRAAGSSGRGGLLQAAKRPPASRPAAPAPPPVFRRGRGALVCAAAGIDVVAGTEPGHYMRCIANLHLFLLHRIIPFCYSLTRLLYA